MFSHLSVWLNVPEKTRKDMYEDVLTILEKREKEEAKNFAQTKYQSAQGYTREYGQGDAQDAVERGPEASLQGRVLYAGYGAAEYGQGGRAHCLRGTHTWP